MENLCEAIRPMDGKTKCNCEAGHDYEHMLLGPQTDDGRDAYFTWAQDGTETCNHCGHRLDASGRCTAPLSAAD